MYRYNVKYDKIKFMVGSCLLANIIFILSFFGIGIITLINKHSTDLSILSSKVLVETSSSRGSTLYTPVYYYNVDGVEHACKSHLSSSIIPPEKQVKIYYSSNNHSKCISEYEYSLSKELFPIYLKLILLTTFIGSLFYIHAYRQSKIVEKLAQNGKLIKNLFCSVIVLPMGIRGKGQAHIIRLRYKTDDDRFLMLNSEIKYGYDYKGKDKADLLIDPLNPKNYFIDFNITEN